MVGKPEIYVSGWFQPAISYRAIGKLKEMYHLKAKVGRGDIEHLRVVHLPHPVAFGTGCNERFCARCLDSLDIPFCDLRSLIDHAHRIEYVPATPLVLHDHKRAAGGIQNLSRSPGYLIVGV